MSDDEIFDRIQELIDEVERQIDALPDPAEEDAGGDE